MAIMNDKKKQHSEHIYYSEWLSYNWLHAGLFQPWDDDESDHKDKWLDIYKPAVLNTHPELC